MEQKQHKSFLKNILVLISGTVIAQIISLLSMVLLQRYFYGPAEFASFKLFYEFVGLFAGVSAFRLETGIVLEEENDQAIALTRLSLKITFITAIFSLLVFLGISLFNASFALMASNIWLVALIPLSVLFIGSIQVLIAWFTREGNFKFISLNKVVQNSSVAVGQLAGGLTQLLDYGLIYGRSFGLMLANLFLFIKFRTTTQGIKTNHIESKTLILKHKDFILFTSPSVFVGTLINFLMIYLFITLYGDKIGGEIGTAQHYIGISLAIISTAFSQVYYKAIATLKSASELRKSYTYWLVRLLLLAVVMITIVQFIPNNWINAVLGEKWIGLMPIIRIMTVWMAVMFISSSLSYIYIKLNRQKEMLIFDIMHLLMIIASIYFPFQYGYSYEVSLWSFTLAQITYYCFAVIIAFYFISKYQHSVK